MLAKLPIAQANVAPEALDREILRLAIISELDAISLYERLAAMTSDPAVAKVLLDIAGEEKTHMGEFQIMLLRADAEQGVELINAKSEIKALTGK